MTGFITLKIRGHKVLDWHHAGLNNSAVALVRSTLTDHSASTQKSSLNAEWPLFFCAGNLRNRCGVISDFSVSHRNGHVILSDFLGCAIEHDACLEVAWRSWAITMEEFGRKVLERSPIPKDGILPEFCPLYEEFRQLLADELTSLRMRLNN